MYFKYKNPKELEEALNEIVIDQGEATKALSLYIYKHLYADYAQYKNISIKNKTNLLILGDTGAGKTFMVKTACELMDMNFVEINGKSICQEGWQGTSFLKTIQEELNGFYEAGAFKSTVIFIDEFDKMCMLNVSSGGDNVAMHLQNGLLKYMEGMRIQVNGTEIDTKDLCFILAGNFKSIREKREDNKPGIGFTSSPEEKDLDNLAKELIDFGVIPEIVGRISEAIELQKPTKETYTKLLNNKNFISTQWKEIFDILGIEFNITSEDINKAIDKAVKNNLGVRGLIQEVQKLINRELARQSDKLDLNELILKHQQEELERFEAAMKEQEEENKRKFNEAFKSNYSQVILLPHKNSSDHRDSIFNPKFSPPDVD